MWIRIPPTILEPLCNTPVESVCKVYRFRPRSIGIPLWKDTGVAQGHRGCSLSMLCNWPLSKNIARCHWCNVFHTTFSTLGLMLLARLSIHLWVCRSTVQQQASGTPTTKIRPRSAGHIILGIWPPCASSHPRSRQPFSFSFAIYFTHYIFPSIFQKLRTI